MQSALANLLLILRLIWAIPTAGLTKMEKSLFKG